LKVSLHVYAAFFQKVPAFSAFLVAVCPFLSRPVPPCRCPPPAFPRQISEKLRDFPRRQPVRFLKKADSLKKQPVRPVFQNEQSPETSAFRGNSDIFEFARVAREGLPRCPQGRAAEIQPPPWGQRCLFSAAAVIAEWQDLQSDMRFDSSWVPPSAIGMM
jgi:hypothetical protein